MKRRRISVRAERCVGCHTCELACAVAHSSSKELYEIVQSGEKPGYRVHVVAYEENSVPVTCSHCDEPACVYACPTGAVHRLSKGAPVLIDNEKCIGCFMCVQACPFGVMTAHPSGVGVLKCDLCIERLAQGEQPACVSSCPTRSLVFGEVEEDNRVKRRETARLMVLAGAAEADIPT